MDPSYYWTGVVVVVFSLFANAVLASMEQKPGKPWGDAGQFVMVCLLLFTLSHLAGYKAYGWLGAVGVFAVHLVFTFSGYQIGARRRRRR
jgi:hypothetical protein